MSEIFMTFLLILVLLSLLGFGVWIAFALLAIGMLALQIFTSNNIGLNLATSLWSESHSWSLVALPLFIWMGEILYRSRIASDMFKALAPWVRFLPGRLLHINILGCGIFAAVSGSSAATAATIGRISIPELEKRNYPKHMTIGTLAGSATLGLLIPPSIILIVYGVATEQSIARLFMAGILPGILLAVLFVSYVVIYALLNPNKIPKETEKVRKKDLLQIVRLIPMIILILCIIGSIYAGLASPIDAAAFGVVVSLIIAWAYGALNKQMFIDSLMGATVTSCMIAFILAGAAFLTLAMGFTGIPATLATWIATLNLSPYMLLFALTLFFIVLGCFLDGISIVVLTTSIIMPMIEQAGISPLWFGIFVVIVVEMSQITPPVGFNLFVIQSLTKDNILKIAAAALPFFFIMCVALALITVFPEIVTYLPENIKSN
ncbi:MAG: TRAP transporter large permease [Alphaproteobacteria bacterium]